MRTTARAFIRFSLGLPLLFLSLILLTLFLKTVFVTTNQVNLQQAGYASVIWAAGKGLRYDTAITIYFLIPVIGFYYAIAILRWRFLSWLVYGYLSFAAALYSVIWLADIQYFEESGKHFTHEAFSYLNSSIVPIISGAFTLHAWFSWLAILICAGSGVVIFIVIRGILNYSLPSVKLHSTYYYFSLVIFIILASIGARGGLQHIPLEIGNSCISPNPYLNALCLNPVYSACVAAISSPKKQVHFYSEEFNIKTTREILGCSKDSPTSFQYPLLRTSSGTSQGNRKNIIIFLLEGWSGKDIDCLGGKQVITPFFDRLASQGMLFTNFYASGVRTAEGLFSILCSFPNQPLCPIMKREEIYQTHWRSISQILAEAGYRNIFIHGRDLKFDAVRDFLKYINFHTVIDRHDFPMSALLTSDDWPGYHDEDVMRRADEEFVRQNGQPFFAIIYTMNTHVPFMVPDGYPLAFEPTSKTNKFLNALNYTDHSLEMFFRMARTRPYFKNTIFILIADHARTRDKFNFSDQHHIPLLLYAPDAIPPSINPAVGGQVDILPTILGLLNLKAVHASWGRDLLATPEKKGFALCVAGNDARWHDNKYLLNDTMSDSPPLLFDIAQDPACTTDILKKHLQEGKELQTKLRAYISLSETLFYKNRVCPYITKPHQYN